jgi:hypothetical protein
MPSISVFMFLWLFTIVANAATALRLYQLDLNRTYRFFFVYLLFQTFRSLALLPFSAGSHAYSNIYSATVFPLWILYTLVVVELYALILKDYTGINSLGQWALRGAIFLSVCISLLSLLPMWGKEGFSRVFWITTVERGVVFSLLLFLLIILMFLSRYPIPLSRNVIIHSIVYTIFFSGISVIILVRNLVGPSLPIMKTLNDVVLGVSATCYLIWIFFLTRKGETTVTVFRPSWDPAHEQRLLNQLNTINSLLRRAATPE